MEGSSSLYVTNHPNKFEGCDQCARGDVSYLVSHVALQDHVKLCVFSLYLKGALQCM